MTHQEGIEQVLLAILALSKEAVGIFCRGNPFDKLLRSYYEFDSLGKSLYRNNRGIYHYKYSEVAYASGLPASKLYGEHRIPLSLTKRYLIESDGTLESIHNILQQNEVILITDDECRLLDSAKNKGGLGLKSNLPHDGSDRLDYAMIKIAVETLRNSLETKLK